MRATVDSAVRGKVVSSGSSGDRCDPNKFRTTKNSPVKHHKTSKEDVAQLVVMTVESKECSGACIRGLHGHIRACMHA